MIEKEKKINVYISDDGKEFLDKNACIEYEEKCLSRIKNLKYFKVICKPDLTEGRGFYGLHLYAIEGIGYNNQYQVEILLTHLFNTLGSPIAYIQGTSPVRNWKIIDVDKETYFNDNQKISVGDYAYNPVRYLITKDGKPIPGFPDPYQKTKKSE